LLPSIAEKVALEQLQKESIMRVLIVVGSLVLGAIGMAALVVVLMHRARKEIESMKIDTEYL
jgi:hypothetical protein